MESSPDRNEFKGRLLEKALEDDVFRSRLIAEPKAVISEELGIALPESLEIEVLEEQPGKLYFVLPTGRAELSDEALEAVAGGAGASPGETWTRTPDGQWGLRHTGGGGRGH